MYFVFNRYLSSRTLVMWISEFSLVFISAFLVAIVVISLEGGGGVSLDHVVFDVIEISITFIIVLYFFDLYTRELYRFGRKMAGRLALATLSAAAILFVLCNVSHPGGYVPCFGAQLGSQEKCCSLFPNILLFSLSFPLILIGWRTIYLGRLASDFPEKRILILGSGELAQKIGNEIYGRRDEGFDLLGYIDDDPAKLLESKVNPGVIGGYGDIASLSESKKADEIIIALSERRAKLPMSALLDCKLKGVSIVEGETFKERMTGKIPLDQLKPSWLVFSDGFKSLRSRKIIKRISDVVLSVTGIILVTPLMAIMALLIKLESKGPVFFRQVRVGEHGKEFELYKFRSMREDAEEKSGPVWAKSDDGRVTRIGKFIRATRIDELPQMINVVKGDMSFVGPRPERPFFVNQLKKDVPFYEVRLVVKPGITGWAQVKYKYGASVRDALEKLQFDLYYIKNMTPLLDWMIILMTIKVVLKGSGAR